MIDMGVEPFLVASTVEAVMAQQLLVDYARIVRRPTRQILTICLAISRGSRLVKESFIDLRAAVNVEALGTRGEWASMNC